MNDRAEPAQKQAEETRNTAVVEHLMLMLSKALRATQLYLPNNPVYQRAIENLRSGFDPVWEECAELDLTVAETDLKWGGDVVLAQPSKSESVAWVLFKDGVRSVTLMPGVEDDEIARFLGVLQEASNLPADAPDDLITLLWEQDFQLLRIESAEMALDDVPALTVPAEEATSPQQVRQQVQEETKEEERPPQFVSTDDFDSTLYFLDEKEIEYLKSEIEREYQHDLRGNVLAMLFDLLELQTYSTVRTELITILENFIPYLLAVGDFRSVAYVLREIHVILERARELLPEHKKTLQGFPDALSEEDALGQLLQSLDEAVVHPSEQELSDLFGELRPQALGTILRWLPRLSNERVQGLLEGAARRLAKENVQQIVDVLRTENDDGLLTTVRLVGQLKLAVAVPVLGDLLAKGDAAARVAVVEALGTIASPRAMQHLEKAVSDAERDVRVAAVRMIGENGHRAAFSTIESAIKGKALRDADLTEKTAFFEAYGSLAGAEALSTLRPMLAPKGFLRRKHDPQTRACAALAISKIGTPEAKQILNAAVDDKDPLVRNAVNRALRQIG